MLRESDIPLAAATLIYTAINASDFSSVFPHFDNFRLLNVEMLTSTPRVRQLALSSEAKKLICRSL